MSTISSARLEANRRNAQLSTGPRTPAGKARSSQNGVTLGLYAKQLLLGGEDQQQLDLLRDGLIASLQPADAFEEVLVDRIISAAWKLQRLARAEQLLFLQGTISRRTALPEELRKVLNLPPREPAIIDGREVMRLPALPQSLAADVMLAEANPALEKLQKQERQLENAILRWTKELRLHRKANRSEPAVGDANDQTEANESTDLAAKVEPARALERPSSTPEMFQSEPKPLSPRTLKPAALLAAATSAVSTLRLGEDRMEATRVEDLIFKQLVGGSHHASRQK